MNDLLYALEAFAEPIYPGPMHAEKVARLALGVAYGEPMSQIAAIIEYTPNSARAMASKHHLRGPHYQVHRPWTPEEDARLLALHPAHPIQRNKPFRKSPISFRSVAAVLGRHRSSVERRWYYLMRKRAGENKCANEDR